MEEKNSIEKLISTGAEIVGAGIGGALGLALSGPGGAIIAGAGGVVATKTLEKIGSEMNSRILGKREKVRVGAVVTYFISKINENFEKGLTIRQDSFFGDEISERSDAEEVYEGLLLATQKEYEEKKIRYMGNLLGNIVFRTEIDKSFANLLIKEASNLSYRQICLIKLFYENNKRSLKSNNYREEIIPKPTIPVLYEIMDLDKRQLINNSEHHVMGLTDIIPKEYLPNGIGVLLYELFELNTMPKEEISDIKELLS